MMIRKLMVFTAIALFALACSSPSGPDEDDRLTGTGSKAGNAFGTVYDDAGRPAQGVTVTLYPLTYNAAKATGNLQIAVTDSNGSFYIADVEAGMYNLACVAPDSQTKSFAAGVTVISENTLHLADTLSKIYQVVGTIDTSWIKVSGSTVLYGSAFTGAIDTTGTYNIKGVPFGTYEAGVSVDSVLEYALPGLNIADLYIPVSITIDTVGGAVDVSGDTAYVRNPIKLIENPNPF